MKQRKSIQPENLDAFAEEVIERYNQDLTDRMTWAEMRLQRYAKLRGWLEQKNYPWPDASNQHVPLLMSNSQRTQDTLHNAVLSTRPVMSAIAVNKSDSEKGEDIDELLDFQFFVEQAGEEKVGDLIESYVNDGRFVAFVPWVREKRESVEIRPIPPIAPDQDPNQVHMETLAQIFPKSFATVTGDGTYKVQWTDELYQPQSAKAEFYLDEEGRHFVELTRDLVIFEGPCVIPKALEDIVVPSRAENLQPPGPSNPNGADHVIMVDYPSWDEINRLYRSGYYDLLTDEQYEKLEGRIEGEVGTQHGQATGDDPEQQKIQKDSMAGQTYGNAKSTAKTFTRLTFFGRMDLDDDGIEEEVVARILLEDKMVCRIRLLQEEFPKRNMAKPRPLACSPGFLPVPGQWYCVSLLELLEHQHDLMKVLLDQMVDKHTLSNSPWGVYRSASGMQPQTIRMSPGELYPVSNPQTDIVFPQLPLQDQTVALNLIALIQQWADKQSMQGSLQFGAVPQGKASALRTSTNMMSVLQQGDARPERILRRFFRGLADVFQQMHDLNQTFLPPNKQYRVTGVPQAGSDPYHTIESPSQISGDFQFDFKANVLNTDKALTSQVLTELAPMLINGLTMQMGLVTVEEVYHLLKDMIQSKGQEVSKYVKAPPQANQPKLTAEDAMGQMVRGILPQGLPAEGAQMHLQALTQFQQDPRYQLIAQQDPSFVVIYNTYLQQVQARAVQEQQMAMLAQQFAHAMGGGQGVPGPPGAVTPGADQMTQQGPGQVNDESMPSAKGLMGA